MSPSMSYKVVEAKKEEEEQRLEIKKYQKGVKHLCETGITKLPTKYILPVSDRPTNGDRNAEDYGIKLPVIDFAQLMQGSSRPQVLQSLTKACEEYGFFQLVNHGIESDVTLNMIEASKRFFNLPFEGRAKYMSADMRAPVRYGTSFNQNIDGVFSWRDFLKLNCHPLPDVLPFWPSSPADLREAAVTYSKEVKFLYLMMMEAILETLGLTKPAAAAAAAQSDKNNNNNNIHDEDDEEIANSWKEMFEDGSQLMVVNCYPACPEPDLTLGMPPHSDYGSLTLLLQDEVKGLQIQHQGRWVTVEPIPNSFVVNVGDHLEIFSNGRYKSVVHRVLVNSVKSRISVASLHSRPINSVIRPSPKLINEANPRRYMDTDFPTFLDYIISCEHKTKNFLESRKLCN
ncbi:hypothetical protein Vadar_026748 [Vaccinium darrowii]|uniref:Uncharacterized protein n=1 Tax=Vaccinium darrowii TaxID=229202 RepID=A0ACB7YR36_9ERIC|nr:hypothetical protein Vadar_026748 [Vaccinium darrowii]